MFGSEEYPGYVTRIKVLKDLINERVGPPPAPDPSFVRDRRTPTRGQGARERSEPEQEAALIDAAFPGTARTLEFGPSDAELRRGRAPVVCVPRSHDDGASSASAVGVSGGGGPRKRVASPERVDPTASPAKAGRRYPTTLGGVEIPNASVENQTTNAIINEFGNNMMKVNADMIRMMIEDSQRREDAREERRVKGERKTSNGKITQEEDPTAQ